MLIRTRGLNPKSISIAVLLNPVQYANSLFFPRVMLNTGWLSDELIFFIAIFSSLECGEKESIFLISPILRVYLLALLQWQVSLTWYVSLTTIVECSLYNKWLILLIPMTIMYSLGIYYVALLLRRFSLSNSSFQHEPIQISSAPSPFSMEDELELGYSLLFFTDGPGISPL